MMILVTWKQSHGGFPEELENHMQSQQLKFANIVLTQFIEWQSTAIQFLCWICRNIIVMLLHENSYVMKCKSIYN